MTTIDKILCDLYGVSVFSSPPIAIVWAAEHLAQVEGVAVAKAELSEANRRRERAGKRPAYVDFGHILF